MSRARVIITNEIPPEAYAPLRGVAEWVMGPGNGDLMTREEILCRAVSADAIINQAELRVDAELLDAAPRLKIVANVSLGTDNLDLDLMARRGIWATNVPGAFVESTADCVMAHLLALARRIGEADAFVRSGDWKAFQPGRWDGMELGGKALGLIGYGRIGRAVAKRARAFGMQVIHYDPAQRHVEGSRELEEVLAESDVVSLHVPLLPETMHLMNAVRFAMMKPGALFLNFARGRIVDEQALVDALESGHLGGAGLDVFENEPDVHPRLLQLSNVVLTPHIGGGTRESRLAARRLACENVAAVLAGTLPLTPANDIRK